MGSDPQIHPERLCRALRQRLESLQRAGVEQIGRSASRTSSGAPLRDETAITQPIEAVISEPLISSSTEVPMGASLFAGDASPRLTLQEQETQLQNLAVEVRCCRLCPEPVANRSQTVFGVGNPQTRLCFFGEAPGADEDRLGEPFVGRAGQLLNKIIEACTLRREEVYILNVLKCRPPKNRTPTGEEAENCRPFFERQLEIIRPEFICCLGAVAASALLAPKSSLGRLRGRLHEWRWAKVLVTYHPAYLLRNPSAKRDVWEDMQLLMKEMGIRIPSR
jgi:DNA polymerase